MPVITEADLRSLASSRCASSPVTSCYLDVDGSHHVRPADYERVLDSMLRRARAGAGDEVAADLERIEHYVKKEFERGSHRGLALFSCAGAELWRVIPLPVPVRSEIVVNPAPAVGQLEAVLQHSEAIGVLAADKQHARVFVYELGELLEHTEITDDIGRDYDTVGEADRGGVDPHRQEMTHQHLRHAADLLWSAYRSHEFAHVAVAAPEGLLGEIERDLHPYLRERLAGRLDVEPSASEHDVRQAAIAMERRIEREREAALVSDLRAAVAANGRGAAGLDDVLDALADHRVERLLVSDGYAHEGWQCPACNRLATVGRECSCGAEMVHVHNVVEEAIEEALAQSARVEICNGNADLDVAGRIGALLRY